MPRHRPALISLSPWVVDSDFEGSLTESQAHHGTGKVTKRGQSRVTIDMLPDVALLVIFDFYVDEAPVQAWHTLVHVCRNWRSITFGSPRRLNLQIFCTVRTPVREMLDVWPLLPIVIFEDGESVRAVDDIVAALEHNDRICQVDLGVTGSHMEKVLAAMEQPFPALTHVALLPWLPHETGPVVPASFLGGSAPRLQSLYLSSIPFPGLPKLLLSAPHLVDLQLWNIRHSGYFSPEAIVTCLSALTRLETFYIGFGSPRSHLDGGSRRPPPPTRSVLPVLNSLQFKGISEYLEDLIARIDAPVLNILEITFFHQLIFDTPHLIQFISRTPKFRVNHQASVGFSDLRVGVYLPQTADIRLKLSILCQPSDWQLSSLAQVLGSSFPQPLIPAVEHLYMFEDRSSRPRWQDDIENSQWLELFHPFTAVKDLYISSEIAPCIAPALQELVGENVTGVLPALQTLFLEETLPSGPAQKPLGSLFPRVNLPVTL